MTGLLSELVLRRTSKAEFSVTFDRHWRDLSQLMRESVLARQQARVNTGYLEDMLRGGVNFDPLIPTARLVWTLFGVDAVSDSSLRTDDAVSNVVKKDDLDFSLNCSNIKHQP